MILYDQNRKLMAISDELIDFLGFNSIEDLKKNINDISNLFEKKPGYIYNFKNFSWINYLLSNSSKEHKAIISLQNSNIEVGISITPLISWDNQTKYFLVNLTPVEATFSNKNLTSEYFSESAISEIEPKEETLKQSEITEKPKEEESLNIDFDNLLKEDEKENISINEEIPNKQEVEKESKENKENNQTIENTELPFEEDLLKQPEITEKPKEEESLNIDFDNLLKEDEKEDNLIAKNSEFPVKEESKEEILYNYKKVSEELEINEDFVKELVLEFIKQSEEIKDKLQKALEENEIKKAHDLFHKIKGAAANLRIEKATKILDKTTGEDDKEKLKEIAKSYYDFLEKFKRYIFREFGLKEKYTKSEQEEISENKEEQKKELFVPYNIELAQKDLDLPKEVILDFINEYIKESQDNKEALYKLIEIKNLEDLSNLIHKLKGSAINLHLEKIVEILNSIQEKIKKEDFDKIKEDIDNFFKYLTFLEDEIKRVTTKEDNIKKEFKKSSSIIGLDLNTYSQFTKKFVEELQAMFKEDENKIKKDIIKYKSMAENLRLKNILEILKKIPKESEIKPLLNKLDKVLDNLKKEI